MSDDKENMNDKSPKRFSYNNDNISSKMLQYAN